MKREIKNFNQMVGIILVVLTGISLVINALLFTNMIYNCSYDTMGLNELLVSTPFNILLWVDNILIFVIVLFYIISSIEEKKNAFIKISFAAFSVLTTIVVQSFAINWVAELFGVF